jgi:hypothetical protein
VKSRLIASIVAVGLLLSGCTTPARSIHPVLFTTQEEQYRAMTAAPLVMLAVIDSVALISEPRTVEKPPNTPGPRTATIPLCLARISARSLLTLRGDDLRTFTFYSWVWGGGKHGGPRLFRPWPGTNHVLFLRHENGYLHTIGDYPSYDLEIPSDSTAILIKNWNSSQQANIFERLAASRLRTELSQQNPDVQRDILDLMGLTSPFFLAGQLDDHCRRLANPLGRFAACEWEGNNFAGRCDSYRRAEEADPDRFKAHEVAEELRRCELNRPYEIARLRSENWPSPFYWLRDPAPERHRLAMRIYASATDPSFHKAACTAAATMPEARDIPECAPPSP